jgi:hypothetical protein
MDLGFRCDAKVQEFDLLPAPRDRHVIDAHVRTTPDRARDHEPRERGKLLFAPLRALGLARERGLKKFRALDHRESPHSLPDS